MSATPPTPTPPTPTPPTPTRVDPAGRPIAASAATRTVLAVGTAVSVACFVIALALEFLGRPTGDGSATDPGAVLRSALALEAWGWATLGTYAVIMSPVAAIVATAAEYLRAGDRRTAWTATGVLVVLAVSLAVSLLGR